MLVIAALWPFFVLPAIALTGLALERGRSPAWGLFAVASILGLVIGLIALYSMEPGNQPQRIAWARYERGEISAEEYQRICAAIAHRL